MDDFDQTVVRKRDPAGAGTVWQAVVVTATLVRTIRLPESGVVQIGRQPRAQIFIDDDSISRFHATLHLADTATLEDLGSANGTTKDGERVQPGRLVQVAPLDVVRLGNVILILQRVET